MLAANKKKYWLAAGVAAPLLLAGAWLVAAERGPFHCDNGCQVGYPAPDPLTAAYVQQMKPLFYRWFGDVFWNKGDIYIICNETYCAKYYITDDFGLYGTGGRERRENGGQTPGGGSTGGGAGSGGCVGSCGTGGGGAGSGTVIVYEPLPEKQER